MGSLGGAVKATAREKSNKSNYTVQAGKSREGSWKGMEKMMIRQTLFASVLIIIATAATTDALYYGKFSRSVRSAPFLPNRADRMVRHIVAQGQNTVEPTRIMNRPSPSCHLSVEPNPSPFSCRRPATLRQWS